MSLRVAIQMDPLHAINPAGDSTLLIAREAQARGHTIYYYTPDTLTYREGTVTARGHKVIFTEDPHAFYQLGDEWHLPLHDMDVVLMRQDPPFDMTYMTSTYLLEQIQPDVLVVNNPVAVRNFPEKIFPTLLEDFMPPTLITADIQVISHFRRDYKDIVIKPLYGYGGRSIFRLTPEDQNFHALLEMFFSQSKEPVVVQQFVPEVADSERRIIMIDGKVAGVVGRIPAGDEIRSNFRVGGTAAKVDLTARQLQLCDELGDTLRETGLLLAGVDMIGDYLTEINITSPTGMAQINQLNNVKLEAIYWDMLESYLG